MCVFFAFPWVRCRFPSLTHVGTFAGFLRAAEAEEVKEAEEEEALHINVSLLKGSCECTEVLLPPSVCAESSLISLGG